MGQYCITKIIDGLFISDAVVPLDVPFLRGNKIICAVGWTIHQQSLFTEDDDIASHLLPKTPNEINFPSYCELEAGFKILEQAHEELLCGLIYSQNQLQASLIATMYLMFRLRWDCNTAFGFVRTKMEAFQFSVEAIECLEQFEGQLRKNCSADLAHVLWDYEFLANYRPLFEEEALLINTIRNKLRPHQPHPSKQSKKTLRVRWQDQIRPSSALKISSSKNLRRSSVNTGKDMINSADIEVLQQPTLAVRSLIPINSVPTRREKEKEEEDFQFMQLKEISRTNFNDRKYMGTKLRRKGSLKPSRPQKVQSSINLQSISQLVGIYSASSRPQSGKTGFSRSGNAPNMPFWSSLRNFSKVPPAHA